MKLLVDGKVPLLPGLGLAHCLEQTHRPGLCQAADKGTGARGANRESQGHNRMTTIVSIKQDMACQRASHPARSRFPQMRELQGSRARKGTLASGRDDRQVS